jgi:Icc-related predicted phosphoesterase
MTPPPKDSVRIAAMADLHYAKTSQGVLQSTLARLEGTADVLVLCGDLTDYGLPEEARLLARELASVRIPMVAVLGNHDFESGKQDEVVSILADVGVTTLDGDATEIHGVGFAGIKGFVGGFGLRTLGPWGEDAIKRFVHETIDEALKLESALARLRTPHRIVLMHYAPIRTTVEGEPLEIFPFLGSSRLEDPLDRYPVTMVFHGHAHHGSLEGKTRGGIPVYNVALPLLRSASPDVPPFRVHEISIVAAPPAAAAEVPS